jgi:hypothetical protein
MRVIVIALGALFCAQPAKAPNGGVADLGWLAGSWRGSDGQSTWETCYSSPEGGEVVSASKEIRGGKVVTYDYERFWDKKGTLVFSPFPRGRKSPHDFPAVEVDAKAQKAVFENAANDFPRKFTYHRAAPDRLVITLEGEQKGQPLQMKLELKRADPPKR